MLDIFPNFRKISLDDKETIEKYTSVFLPYSDYNFVSLWVYNVGESIEVCLLYDNLVIKFEDYVTSEPFYSFLGTSNVIETSHNLIHYAQEKGIHSTLKLIPEDVIKSDATIQNEFIVTEDPDNFDYILSLEQLSHLQGRRNKAQRKFVNGFENQNPHFEIRTLDCTSPQMQAVMLEITTRWGIQKQKSAEDTQHEYDAIQRLLTNAHSFILESFGIFINNALIGFTIVELLNQSYAINHFMKFDTSYRGITAKLDNIVGIELQKRGYTYLNIEQDLGIAGLKQAKMLLHPISYLKKFTIASK